jgi:phage-related protein
MQSTTKIHGDLGRSLLTPANSLRIMKTEFTKLARAVGSIFIPIMMKIIPVVRVVTQILTQAAQAIANLLGFKMENFNADLGSVGNLLSGVSDDIGGVGDEADSTAKKLNKMLMPFDELNNVNFDTGSASGAGAGGIGDGGSLGIELPTYDMFASMSESMDNTIDKIKDGLKTLFEPIQSSWNTYGQGVIDSFKYSLSESFRLSEDIGKSIAEVWSNGTGEETMNIIFQSLTNIFNIIGDIKSAFANAWEADNTGTQIIQNLWNAFNNLLGIVQGVFDTIRSYTQSQDFQNFANAVIKIVGTLSAIFEKITGKLKEIWDNGGSYAFGKLLEIGGKLVELINIVFQALSPVINTLLDFVTPVIEGIIHTLGGALDMLSGILDFLIGVFTGDWERAWKGIENANEGFKKTLEGLWEAIKGFFGGIFDFVYKTTIEPFVNSFKQFWDFIESNWEERKKQFSIAINWIKDKIIIPVINFFSNLHDNIKTIFDNIKNAISEKINNIKTTVETVFSKIKEKITGPIQSAKEIIKNAIENIKGFFKFQWEFPKLKTPHISWSTQPAPGWISNILKAINLPAEIPKLNVSWYENGGFPDAGQLFVANEAGPELIGNIGNRTAVANQNQIVDAVSKGVHDAVVSAIAQSGSNQSPYIVVNLGNEQIYKGLGQYRNEQANMYGINV